MEALMENQIIKYDVTDAAITQMEQEYSVLTIKDKESYDVVVKAIADVRTKRTDVEKRRKELKESALVWGRKVDAEAKRVTARLVEIEGPLKALKQEEDEKRMAAQREAERKEAERVAEIKALINQIRERVPTVPVDSAYLGDLILELGRIAIIPDVFMEFFREACQTKQDTLDRLNQMFQDRLQWEEEERQRKEELAHLEALRAENERLERERQIREAREQAAKEAEEKARRAELEKIEAEKRAIEAEKARIEAEKKAEQERKAQEERDRLWRIEQAEKARSKLLNEIDCIYPVNDLGTMPDHEWNQLYCEQKTKWDAEQERLRLEQEEQARKEREEFEHQAKLKAEQETREKLEREEQERQAQLKAEEEEQKRQEALKPDREKLLILAEDIINLKFPVVNDEAAIQIITDTRWRLAQTADDIKDKVAKL